MLSDERMAGIWARLQDSDPELEQPGSANSDIRLLMAEVKRLRVCDREKFAACQAALRELRGHLEKGTAAPILEKALGMAESSQEKGE